jgi:hypothetical protein
LEEEKVSFARGGHLSASAAPLVILEMFLIRFLDWLGSSELSSAVILGVYRRLPQADQSWSQDYSPRCSVAALGCEEKVAAEATRPGFKARA